MTTSFAAMMMSWHLHCEQTKCKMTKRRDSGVAECIYVNKVNKIEEKEKYEKKKLPQSGYCTVEEYEAASRAKTKDEIKVEKGKVPDDKNMVYVPQKTFKLVKYNNPAGSPELHLPRKLNFDRQINAQGIVSGDKTMMVYPAVYYYAQADVTSCDLFVIKLDPSMNETDRVMKANIISKEEKPILSTSKEIDDKYVFRTLTPIDFSADNTKLVIKEKLGHRSDGIWKTDLWVYDFEKKEAIKLPQIRDAIVNYWLESKDVDFDEKRWDIYPMGFDANDDNRVIVCAYAYTGDVPKFLGTWSIDVDGNDSKLESLGSETIPVSVIGYRLAEDSVKDISEIKFDAKQAKYRDDAKKKEIKKNVKYDKKVQKLEHERRLQQMDIDTYYKIKQRKELQKEQKKARSKIKETVTGEN